MAWHCEEELKARTASLDVVEEWQQRAMELRELEGSEGGMVGVLDLLIEVVVDILKMQVADFLSVWLGPAGLDVLARPHQPYQP
jgi:hypothetical protein